MPCACPRGFTCLAPWRYDSCVARGDTRLSSSLSLTFPLPPRPPPTPTSPRTAYERGMSADIVAPPSSATSLPPPPASPSTAPVPSVGYAYLRRQQLQQQQRQQVAAAAPQLAVLGPALPQPAPSGEDAGELYVPPPDRPPPSRAPVPPPTTAPARPAQPPGLQAIAFACALMNPWRHWSPGDSAWCLLGRAFLTSPAVRIAVPSRPPSLLFFFLRVATTTAAAPAASRRLTLEELVGPDAAALLSADETDAASTVEQASASGGSLPVWWWAPVPRERGQAYGLVEVGGGIHCTTLLIAECLVTPLPHTDSPVGACSMPPRFPAATRRLLVLDSRFAFLALQGSTEGRGRGEGGGRG